MKSDSKIKAKTNGNAIVIEYFSEVLNLSASVRRPNRITGNGLSCSRRQEEQFNICFSGEMISGAR